MGDDVTRSRSMTLDVSVGKQNESSVIHTVAV